MNTFFLTSEAGTADDVGRRRSVISDKCEERTKQTTERKWEKSVYYIWNMDIFL